MNKFIIGALALGVGIAGTRYLWPRIEYKHTVQEKEVIRKDIVTVIKEVVRPDGSKETVTEIVDRSKESSTRKETLTKAAQPQWSVGAYTTFNEKIPTYTVTVDRRILGPFSLGVYGQTNSTFGAGIRLEF